MKRILAVFGTRPEAVKMCPVVAEMKNRKTLTPLVCVTGQHREMSDAVLRYFCIKPDYNLAVMRENQDLFDITEKVLRGFRDVLREANPDLVLVHGDTTTAFAAALAAFYLRVPVGHVEAGLRTYRTDRPFPEEFNRQAVGVLATWHFAPTPGARDNLLREGKDPGRVFVTGNTAVDALKSTVRADYTHPELERARGRRLILFTAHRREHWGRPLEGMLRALRRLADEREDVHAVYPVHPNPAVRTAAERILRGHPRISLIEPLEVPDFHNFLARADLVLTDSGGIQEEAPSFGVPVLVMRERTERPEGLETGALCLTGTEEEAVLDAARAALRDSEIRLKTRKTVNPYGDGHACARICDVLERLPNFSPKESEP